MLVDQRTFLTLVDMANGLDKDIQMEMDVPSVHQDATLPVLNLGLKVVRNQVEWTFFSKPCTSPYTIHYRSANSMKQKRETLLQEGLRRIRNTSKSLDREIVNNTLSQFMDQLRISGHDLLFQYNLLTGILNREDQVEAKIQSGKWQRLRS